MLSLTAEHNIVSGIASVPKASFASFRISCRNRTGNPGKCCFTASPVSYTYGFIQPFPG